MKIYRDRSTLTALRIAERRVNRHWWPRFSEGYEMARTFRDDWSPARCVLWALDACYLCEIAAEIRKEVES